MNLDAELLALGDAPSLLSRLEELSSTASREELSGVAFFLSLRLPARLREELLDLLASGSPAIAQSPRLAQLHASIAAIRKRIESSHPAAGSQKLRLENRRLEEQIRQLSEEQARLTKELQMLS